MGTILARATILLLCLTPLTATEAAGQNTLRPWRQFYESLRVRTGLYYVVSPEIIGSATGSTLEGDVTNIAGAVKQRMLNGKFVIVYGEDEEIGRRAELATKNMAVIRHHLPPSVTSAGAMTGEAWGVPDINMLFTGVYSSCHLNFLNEIPRGIVVSTRGHKVNQTQLCVGFGIAAALAGYEIVPRNHGLQFQRVFAVKQGAMIGGRARRNPHAQIT